MSPTVKREIQGIALLLFAVFLAGALLWQGVATLRGVEDLRDGFGWVGEVIARPLVSFFGWPAAALLPLAPGALALRLFGRLDPRSDRSWMSFVLGLAIILPFGIGLLAGADRAENAWAGLWGGFTAFYAVQFAGTAGAWIVFLLVLSVLTAVTLSWNPVRMIVGHAEPQVDPSVTATEDEEYTPPRSRKKKLLAEELAPAPEELPAIDPSDSLEPVQEIAQEDEPSALPLFGEKKKRKTKADLAAEHASKIAAEIDSTEHTQEQFTDEDLPPSDLLSMPPARNAELGRRELDLAGQRLMDTLRTFRVDGELIGRTTGPAVTQFEVAPAAGVKVRQIANLANDLALAMRAPSIRVVAPIPGKGAVGIEVPNPVPEVVGFRELIESPEFRNARAALPIALGKDLEGRPLIADLAKMPHLLIAGATGAGKSVCINTLITSLLYRHTPKTLRFLMVDPKMVELSVYNTIPHLRHKVVTDNRDAAAVLKWAVMEMQERYELLAANGARNLQDFNKKVADGVPLKTPKRPDVAFEDRTYKGGPLPYIVLIIDELADLMMTVQGEVETPLAMLAQKARAIGIHLILATQRPSVNVITGLIKANFPSRIAFRVASQIDSRTILDGVGAESLLGNGDMLFIPPGKSEPSRVQGAYISSEDTEKLMQWFEQKREARRAAFEAQGLLVEEGPPEEDILETVRQRELLESGGGDNESNDDSERDKLFRDAAEVVIQHQQGSTSLLQRRLKVGYGRAARIIDQLHAAGVLGPPDGSKPRDVLIGLEDLDRIAPKG
jgi:S-DNA-T family DNA segregation ATPase FtsK/SpoIIIE